MVKWQCKKRRLSHCLADAGGNPLRMEGIPPSSEWQCKRWTDNAESVDSHIVLPICRGGEATHNQTNMNNSSNHNYYVYITTNKIKTVLYIGVTNDLKIRLHEHEDNAKSTDKKSSFSSRYNVHFLIYFERFQWIQHAIAREKELKGWRRNKKQALIATVNPEWNFLNDTIE